MFVDELTIHLKAGLGGDGVVRWRHEKGKEYGGPSGGNGGKGGDVYAVAVSDIGILAAYRNIKEISAERGQAGKNQVRQGAGGKDKKIKLPVGSRIKNVETGHVIELMEEGQEELLLRGGMGGLGNDHFKSSTNVRPKEHTDGDPGEEADFYIELLLVVDVGLVGLPNAGKSSLLNALTPAKSKVGSFRFTTLEPHLGTFYKLIIADMPGLIEGAAGVRTERGRENRWSPVEEGSEASENRGFPSRGRGLGHKFLRHIERTRSIVHCVSSEEDDPVGAYKTIRKELKLYNEEIVRKPEIVVLTKVDLVTPEEAGEKIKALKSVSDGVLQVSILDDKLIKEFGDYLTNKITNT